MDKELLEAIDRMLARNQIEASALQTATLDAVKKWLLQFDVEGGRISATGSQRILAAAQRAANQALFTTKYARMVDGLIADFDQITVNLEAIHKQLNGIKFSRRFIEQQLNPAKAFAVNETITALSETAISANALAPIKKVLVEAIQFGYSIPEAQSILEQRMKVADYIGQISRDSLFQYDGTVNNLIAEEYGLDGIRYVGTTVEDTRGQCKRWMEMGTIPKSELEAEIKWAKSGGSYKGRKKSGMISNTTERNFMVYRGGYNCRHRAFPVRLSS